MPKRIKRSKPALTPLREQLASLSMQQHQLHTAIAEDVLVQTAREASGTATPPTAQGPVALMRAMAPVSAVATCRTEQFIYQVPKVTGPRVCLERGLGEDPLLVPPEGADLAAWRQALGPDVATATEVMLKRRCNLKTLQSLAAGSSAPAAREAMRYLMGQVLRGRGLARVRRDSAAEAVLGAWLRNLLQVHHPQKIHLTVVASRSTAMTQEAQNLAVLTLDAEAYSLFAAGTTNPLLVCLRHEGREALLRDVSSEHYAASLALLMLTKGADTTVSEAAANAVMAALLKRLQEETAHDSADVQLAALKVYGHLCLTAGRLHWLRMCLSCMALSDDVVMVLRQFMFTSVALGNHDAVKFFIDVGVGVSLRCERFVAQGVKASYYGEHGLHIRSPTLLHAAASITGPTWEQRRAVLQVLLDHGADPTALAACGTDQDTQTYQYMGTSAAMHAVLVGHIRAAAFLSEAAIKYQNRRRAQMLPLIDEVVECLTAMISANQIGNIEAFAGSEGRYRAAIERLQWDYGFAQNDERESGLADSLSAVISRLLIEETPGAGPAPLTVLTTSWEAIDTAAPHAAQANRAIVAAARDAIERHFERLGHKEQAARCAFPSVGACLAHALSAVTQARDIWRCQSGQSAVAHNSQDAEQEVQQAAREVAEIGILTHLNNCRPLSWCSLRGDPEIMRAVVALPARVYAPDLALAYALSYQPPRAAAAASTSTERALMPKKAVQAMRTHLMGAAATPAAMVALMQVAALLGDAHVVRALVVQSSCQGIEPWRHPGQSVAVLASTMAEMAADALGPFLRSFKDAPALDRVFRHTHHTGDTVFHVAARTADKALEALLSVTKNKAYYLDICNVSGHTALEVAINLQRTRAAGVMLRAFSAEALNKLNSRHLLGLYDDALWEVLDVVRSLPRGETWLRAHLPMLVQGLEGAQPQDVCSRRDMAQRLRRRFARLDIEGLLPVPAACASADARSSQATVQALWVPAQDEPRPAATWPRLSVPPPTRPDEPALILAQPCALKREREVAAWLQAQSSVVLEAPDAACISRAWRIIDALHVASSGQGMGRHYAAHEPTVPLPALRARAVAFKLCAASRFGAKDSVALLHLRERARQLMLQAPPEPLALFAVNLHSEQLSGNGYVVHAAGQAGAYYHDSRRIRFVMRHPWAGPGVDFIAIYPIASSDRRPTGVLKRL